MNQIFAVLDYETRSECDLKKSGASEYAQHPSTEIMCVSWQIGTLDTLRDAPVGSWSPAIEAPYGDFKKALLDETVQLVAHNAFFEEVITKYVLPKYIKNSRIRDLPVERWICTAAMAAAHALPRKLENACLALNLPFQKDMEGHKLVLKYCKPTAKWNRWMKSGRPPAQLDNIWSEDENGTLQYIGEVKLVGGEPKEKFHSSLKDLKRIMQYCESDVRAETELFLSLPRLNPLEEKVWQLDQKINHRGYKIDRELVTKSLSLIDEEKGNLSRETNLLASGLFENTTQRNEVLAWLDREGVRLPNLQAKTVKDTLFADGISQDAKRMLEIRQAFSKTSTAKFLAFERRSRADGRLRDSLLYWAASTGRWGGMGIQPQNFPRGSIKNTSLASEIVKEFDLETLRMFYGDPMSALSSILRSCIVASDGKEFFCGDKAQIEVRVLFWIAHHDAGLDAFRNGDDLYREMAAAIYGIPLELVTKIQRDLLGKPTILGAGFQMGADKFQATCEKNDNPISQEMAKKAIHAYREKHWPVPNLWANLEKAAIAAVRNKKKYTINRTSWWMEKNFLYCELPSGRRLAYYKPEIHMHKMPWGDVRPVMFHWGVDPTTKKWVFDNTYGGKLTENVVQAIARDFMAEAMLRLENAGYEVVLSVHDELLTEKAINEGNLTEFESVMSELPKWAGNFPMKVEGWKGLRYRK